MRTNSGDRPYSCPSLDARVSSSSHISQHPLITGINSGKRKGDYKMTNKHAIIQGGTTRFTVHETELRESLENQIAFILDLKPENIEELLKTGKTETVDIVGRKRDITIEYCECNNMASHVQN
jgi:hypothetical protein